MNVTLFWKVAAVLWAVSIIGYNGGVGVAGFVLVASVLYLAFSKGGAQ